MIIESITKLFWLLAVSAFALGSWTASLEFRTQNNAAEINKLSEVNSELRVINTKLEYMKKWMERQDREDK